MPFRKEHRGAILVGGAALLFLWLLSLGAGAQNDQSPGNDNQWHQFQATGTMTRDFRSPYPWIEAIRLADGQRGYFVFAPADNAPADWPRPMNLVSQHIIGYWQFVLPDLMVEPDKDGICRWNQAVCWNFDGATARTALAAFFDDMGDPAPFRLTSRGQAAVQAVP